MQEIFCEFFVDGGFSARIRGIAEKAEDFHRNDQRYFFDWGGISAAEGGLTKNSEVILHGETIKLCAHLGGKAQKAKEDYQTFLTNAPEKYRMFLHAVFDGAE